MTDLGSSGRLPVPRRPLAQAEYEAIYSRVPRLTVEVVITSSDGVVLSLRDTGPCRGLWHIPGGTVRFGEPLTDAVRRVARQELGLEVAIDRLLGYIEYPSHLQKTFDWPVGVAFATHLSKPPRLPLAPPAPVRWFAESPADMHEEQRAFLGAHGLLRAGPGGPELRLPEAVCRVSEPSEEGRDCATEAGSGPA